MTAVSEGRKLQQIQKYCFVGLFHLFVLFCFVFQRMISDVCIEKVNQEAAVLFQNLTDSEHDEET